MTKYARLINKTTIEFPPKNKGSIINYNLNIPLLIQGGYKILIPAEVPPETEIRMYHSEYQENADNIEEIVVFDETQEEAEEREAEAEIDRINHLTMTALDFINVLKNAGVTDEAIEEYLNANLHIKHQLEFCQNVYCGVAKSLMPITIDNVTITAEMVENAFKAKHGEC